MGMAQRRDEPQSDGSQNFTRMKGNPSSQRRGDFYANGRDRVRADDDDEVTQRKVTSLPSGAKRDSYFKKRDY
jgi:hypothetical protein